MKCFYDIDEAINYSKQQKEMLVSIHPYIQDYIKKNRSDINIDSLDFI